MSDENEPKMSADSQPDKEGLVPPSPDAIEEESIEKEPTENVEVQSSPEIPELPVFPERAFQPVLMMAAPSRRDRFPKEPKSLEKKDSKEAKEEKKAS